MTTDIGAQELREQLPTDHLGGVCMSLLPLVPLSMIETIKGLMMMMKNIAKDVFSTTNEFLILIFSKL